MHQGLLRRESVNNSASRPSTASLFRLPSALLAAVSRRLFSTQYSRLRSMNKSYASARIASCVNFADEISSNKFSSGNKIGVVATHEYNFLFI